MKVLIASVVLILLVGCRGVAPTAPITGSVTPTATAARTAALRPINPTANVAVPSAAGATDKPALVPSMPTRVKFDEHVKVSKDELTAEITQTVAWLTPRSKSVEIRVYGVTECIAEPAHPRPDTHGPCLVAHTPLPESVRTLLATAPASNGTVKWTWTEDTGCDIGMRYDPNGPAYYAIVLAAYSASGHSIFAIAEPGGWWEPGPNDVVC